MYVKWTADLQEKGTKVTVHLLYISFAQRQICLRVFWEFRGVGGESPVGLKESYLLLLPITPQSLALSTCKMTLDMPVLRVFYRWRLCFLVMRPRGAQGPYSLPLSHQLTECIHRLVGAMLILSRNSWLLSWRGSMDISRRKLNEVATSFLGWALVWGWYAWIGVQFLWTLLS